MYSVCAGRDDFVLLHMVVCACTPLPPSLPSTTLLQTLSHPVTRSLYTQVDGSPDRPAPGEIREKEARTPGGKSGGSTPIDGMIIGANVNSYLRRGAEFDVMRNVEAGVEDAGVYVGWCVFLLSFPLVVVMGVLRGGLGGASPGRTTTHVMRPCFA